MRVLVRTTAYLLDASSEWLTPFIPVLKSVPSEMQFGLDSVIGAILPGVGDILGTLLGLYQVFLSMLFGIPLYVLGMMVCLPLMTLCAVEMSKVSTCVGPVSDCGCIHWPRPVPWYVLHVLLSRFVSHTACIGDFLDVAFKANMYNLQLLEKELKKSKWGPIVRHFFLVNPSPYRSKKVSR